MDDDRDLRESLRDALQTQGFETECAADGVQALQYIRRDPTKIRLVLLDIVMPRMSRYEVLTRLQKDTELKTIPVLLMTAQCVQWNELLQHAAVQKPFSATSMAACVKMMSRPGANHLMRGNVGGLD